MDESPFSIIFKRDVMLITGVVQTIEDLKDFDEAFELARSTFLAMFQATPSKEERDDR